MRDLLSQVDVADFLKTLNVRGVRPQGSEIHYSCPFDGHKHGDKNGSATMNRDSTTFYCFGCQRKGDAITFLAEYEGIKYLAARRKLRDMYGELTISPDVTNASQNRKSPAQERIEKNVFASRLREAVEPVYLPESIQRGYEVNWKLVWEMHTIAQEPVPEPFAYMLNRGFDFHVLDAWGIGYDDQVSQRITIPWRTITTQLVGYKGRAWWEDAIPKYLVLGDKDEETTQYGYPTMDVSEHLFGIQIAQHSMMEHGLIVREGELNVLMMHQHGWDNTVGVSGRKLSAAQAAMILKMDPPMVLFSFDDVEDSMRAARRLNGRIAAFVTQHSDNDPAVMTYEELDEYVGCAVSHTVLS